MDFYKGNIPILDPDDRHADVVDTLNPKGVSRGYVERDWSLYPSDFLASPSQIKLIEPSDYDAWYDEEEEQRSSLEHLYLSGPGGSPAFVNLDQNGHGFCWSYSNGHALMIERLKANQPLVRLNPHSTAAIIKGGRDEGGWCGLAAKFIREHGMASEEFWPKHSLSLRNDTPACRANMSLHRVVEDWVDLTKEVYDQNLTKRQLDTCLFNKIPCPTDFPWWSHSVCALRCVRIEGGSWGILILNSWLNWGRHGLAVLRGSRSIPGGAVAVRSSVASVS